jgi:hypothetical protein
MSKSVLICIRQINLQSKYTSEENKAAMEKKKTELDFIHSFIPPRPEESGAGTATRRRKIEGKAFTTFLLLHGTGGNEQDLIPLVYELDKRAAILSPRGKVLENGITPRFFRFGYFIHSV